MYQVVMKYSYTDVLFEFETMQDAGDFIYVALDSCKKEGVEFVVTKKKKEVELIEF